MREEIEQALSVLLGKPLWGSNRAVDMEMFQFGDRHVDGPWRSGDYSLNVQCPWVIKKRGRILVESGDVYLRREDEKAGATNFHWDQIGANRRDERLEHLFQGDESRPLTVERIQADESGVAIITFSGDVSLELSPPTAQPREWWRLFQTGQDTEHFVVTADGIERVGPQ